MQTAEVAIPKSLPFTETAGTSIPRGFDLGPTVGVPPFPFGMLGDGFSVGNPFRAFRGRKGKRAYQPDITSILTGRTAKRAPRGTFGGLFSGIELRPMLR